LYNPWVKEAWRLAAFTTLALIVGITLQQVFASLFVFLLLYMGWHFYNLYRLDRWFQQRESTTSLDAAGIWGEIFNHVYRLQRNNQQRKVKLRKMLSRFQKSTAAMPDATVVINEYDEIEWFNKAAKTYLGLKKKKDRGQRVDNLIRNEKFSALLSSGDFKKAIEFPSPVNDSIQLSVRLVPYGGNKLLMVARNVTRLQKLERVRQDFVANVSHELRTPLTVINGYLENLVDAHDVPTEQLQKVLKQMVQQSNRMSRIVDDLLMLSRLESDEGLDHYNDISVPAIIAAILEECNPLSGEKHQQIKAEIDHSLWLKGDEKEIYSALSNLIINAIKYTPEKGDIHIRWQLHDKSPGFAVQDSGIGIAANHLPRLTERFYRVDKGRSRDQGGTGLGLAIVKHVLSRHGARLQIESEPGKGSTFSVQFPEDLAVIKPQNLPDKLIQGQSS
jgi:two-component system phosphate regulon sensor histidine kinase PhoR